MIDVDLKDLMPDALYQFLANEDLVEPILDDLITSARLKWINLAQAGLHATRQDYIEAIQEPESAKGERSITLDNSASHGLVGWIEEGKNRFDVRTTVLKNKNYAVVPFRHGTPGTVGRVGTPMGQSYMRAGEQPGRSMGSRAAAGHLSFEMGKEFGRELHAIAKRLGQQKRSMTAAMVSGAMEKTRYLGTGAESTQRMSTLLKPSHLSSIYRGMQQIRKTYRSEAGKRTTQSQYMTFRTISRNVTTATSHGRMGSWMHPGIEPHHYAHDAADHLSDIAGATIRKVINEAFKK